MRRAKRTTSATIVIQMRRVRCDQSGSSRFDSSSRRYASQADASFRDRVLASRRPFVGALPSASGLDRSRVPDGIAGVWAGDPVARRFRGLAVEAHVQAGLRTSDCTLDLVR